MQKPTIRKLIDIKTEHIPKLKKKAFKADISVKEYIEGLVDKDLKTTATLTTK